MFSFFKDISKPDFGDPVEIKEGEIPVFWACGVTSQMAVTSAPISRHYENYRGPFSNISFMDH